MLNRDQKQDFDALLPGTSSEAGASRRTALKAALGVGYAAAAMPIMAQTAIKTPADLKGVKIRTPPDDMTIAIFNALGANPAPLTFAELPTALQSGVFEAQENPLTNIYSSKLHEITKYISLTGHKYETAPLLASMAWWSSLSPEDQACVQSSADEATAFQRQTAEEKQTEVRQKLVEEGAIITEIQDRQAFIDATASVYDEYRERFPELVDTIVAEAKK